MLDSFRFIRLCTPLALSIVAAACGNANPSSSGGTGGNTDPPIELPPPMGDIAPVNITATDRFATHSQCAQCHFGGPETTLLHDPAGNDISPVYLWRSSMMAFAARDPYYLAIFGEELLKQTNDKAFVETTCTRCHAPAGSVEHEQTGGHLTFDSLMSGDTPETNLGRDGVTCTLCHQIADENLGKTASFTGGFTIGYERKIYGPHLVPKVDPMQLIVNYTPTSAGHITTSEVCATCHTVVIPIMKNGKKQGDFLEQAPYLEWKNSTYSPGVPCGTCHMPTKDDNMVDLESPIAKWPDGLPPRKPFGKHRFSGGNAYMLRLLADNVAFTGSTVPSSELLEAADAAESHLAEGAAVSILTSSLEGETLAVVVSIENHTGHKLPTAYPGRRVWVHLRAEGSSGEVLFESGGFDASGALVDRAGKRLDVADAVMPHRDVIQSENEVQVYESIAKNAAGKPTHLPLESVGYLKDNRILPVGWSKSDQWIEWIGPVGVTGDLSFGAGLDLVEYRIPKGSAVKRVTVRLLYQTVRPTELEAIAKVPHPAAVRFSQMASGRSPLPTVMAEAAKDL
ncbi:MAG: hypothetical protein IPM54_23965 [Polyangiaceae bacterium]|nr:hypothetical protein [Polyangiaceae bacterium]